MNREIKFRGKSNRTGEWLYGLPKYNSGGAIGYICGWMGEDGAEKYEEIEVIPETVGQFTGHQIGGQDLYEADIIRLEENADGIDPDDRMTYYIVVWLQEWCMFALLRAEDEYPDYLAKGAEALDADMFWTLPLDPQDTETSKHYLCGSIHTHPHLLTNNLDK